VIRKTTLDNGARIITEVVEGVYSASIGIWVDVGSRDEDEKNNGVSHCLEHMLFKGTAKRTARDIAQEIEDVVVRMARDTPRTQWTLFPSK